MPWKGGNHLTGIEGMEVAELGIEHGWDWEVWVISVANLLRED